MSKYKKIIDNWGDSKYHGHYICPFLKDECVGLPCRLFIVHDFPFHEECSITLLGELAIKLGVKGRRNWVAGYEEHK